MNYSFWFLIVKISAAMNILIQLFVHIHVHFHRHIATNEVAKLLGQRISLYIYSLLLIMPKHCIHFYYSYS